MRITRAPSSIRRLIIEMLVAGGVLAATACGQSSGDAADTGNSAHPADIAVSPAKPLFDEPVAVRISGLTAGTAVAVRASTEDRAGVGWSSTAQFTASDDGTVTLADASTGGSYTGTDPMGVFLLMAPEEETDLEISAPDLSATTYDVTLDALVGQNIVASTVVHFAMPAAVGVTEKDLEVATDGVYGQLFLPSDTSTPRPAVVLWGGSEGGLYLDFALNAAALAAHGYPALAIAFYGEPGLPDQLVNIPIEYFAKAATLLSQQPGVDPSKLVAMGPSRGSEAAMLVGIHYPDLVHAVVAAVPSSLVFGGVNATSEAAWTVGGQPVAFASHADFVSRTTDPPDAPDAVIPAEKIAGPMFMVCGGQDSIWASCTYEDAIKARRSAAGVGANDVALEYPAGGHFVGDMTCCYSDTYDTGGGFLADTANGREDAHAALLAFLAGL